MEDDPLAVVTEERSYSPTKKNVCFQANEDMKDLNESEYESTGSYSEEGEYKEKNEGSEVEENISDSEKSIVLVRQEGDGQESIPQKKVDDDEDKKNPQYIPKRGTFYEHDDRTAEDVEAEDAEEAEKLEKESKKKLWQDKKERWSHDRFNDDEQAPKSKSELVQIYGYDIRNEDGPPRARRRRRYGRGPNKYTRNWEDEDAYGKLTPQRPKKPQKPPSQSNEEFPPLDNQIRRINKSSENVEPSTINKDKEINRNNRQNSRRSEERDELPTNEQPQLQNISSDKKYDSGSTSADNKFSRGSKVPKEKNESLEVNPSEYKGFTTKTRMGRNFKSQSSNSRNQKKDDFIQSQNFSRRTNGNSGQMQAIENSMADISIQDNKNQEKGGQSKNQNNHRQGSVPPRLQGEQKGSKRYSSIRQRSLPETNNPPIMHANYYNSDINQQQQPQSGVIHQNPNLLQTPGTITQMTAPPNLPLPQQVPGTAAPILQAPPQFATTFPQPPAFISAPVPPPTFMPQQPLINYVQTPPQYPAGFQSYQAPFNPVTQSTELYQPQGGITYYSTDQQITQRIAPQKRPKAAIPIVAPPTLEMKNQKSGDDRLADYVSESNSIE